MILIVCIIYYMYNIWIYVYMYVYYELIVFLFVGANAFWIFDFSDILQYPKLLIFVFFVDFCVF